MSLVKRGAEIADELAEMLEDVCCGGEDVFSRDDIIDMAYEFVEEKFPEVRDNDTSSGESA